MKKNSNKSSKNPKTKIQLKIKSKTVTNNFILTPRTVSPRDIKEIHQKSDRNVDDIKSDKHRYEDTFGLKIARDNKTNQYRRSITDHAKLQVKKKFEEDQTGTHTPQVKRMAHTQDGFYKKKSTHSLLSSEKNRQRKKNNEKLSKNLSGELSAGTFQRIIGIIIKDYKQGKLKEKELEQTLIELFDRKKDKNQGKKKRKEINQQPFSNEFLRSVTRHTRSQALTRKRKSSYDQEMIEERILERQGFVNKIIVKGITTSMFLKDQDSDSYIKESKSKTPLREPNFNIHTSNSVREINEEMRLIQAQYEAKIENKTVITYEDMMASRIQRAWRKYKTRKLLSHNAFERTNQNVINILDEFTDEEINEQINSPIDCLKAGQKSLEKTISPLNYEMLTQIILKNLQEKNITKQECLKNILGFLNVSETGVQIEVSHQEIQQEQSFHEAIQIQEVKSEDNSSEEDEVLGSRIRPLQVPLTEQKNVFNNLQQAPSNQLQMNSFTNKYSSKQNVENNDLFKSSSPQQQNEIVDNSSLTFVHSQTVANQTFKSINIQNIEDALQTREEGLSNKKERETQELTQKLLGNKITKEEYLREKEKIDKWYKSQLKQLKKVKKSLIKSCNQACKVLEFETERLSSEKSSSMMKCLSEKYIKNNDWVSQMNASKKRNRLEKKQKCEQQDNEQDIRTSSLGFKDNLKSQELEQASGSCLIFNSKQKMDEEQEQQDNFKKYEMSPKLTRLQDESDDITDYKYEEVQHNIDQEPESIQEGLLKFNEIHHQHSDKYAVCYDEDEIEAHQISLINNFVSQSNRFKYLCQEDKEDIFQFLFLDLVLQMFTQTLTGQNKILKAAEVYITKAKRLKRIPKGIKTSIASSKQYIGVLTKFILNQKNGLKNLSHPMGPSAIEMLRYMRDEIVETDEEEAISSTLVLSIDVFEKVSRLPELELKLEKYYEDEQKEHNRLSFLRTALNINNKSLFDSLNENLDHQRPYGVWGKPFPWKKVLALDRKWSHQEEQNKLKKSIEKTIQSCSYLCGILVDKQDSLFGSHRVSEEYVMQIRQDRLSKMLANELIQNQERWIFYDDEETQILMDISSYITKKLIKEVVLDMVSMSMKF